MKNKKSYCTFDYVPFSYYNIRRYLYPLFFIAHSDHKRKGMWKKGKVKRKMKERERQNRSGEEGGMRLGRAEKGELLACSSLIFRTIKLFVQHF